MLCTVKKKSFLAVHNTPCVTMCSCHFPRTVYKVAVCRMCLSRLIQRLSSVQVHIRSGKLVRVNAITCFLFETTFFFSSLFLNGKQRFYLGLSRVFICSVTDCFLQSPGRWCGQGVPKTNGKDNSPNALYMLSFLEKNQHNDKRWKCTCNTGSVRC